MLFLNVAPTISTFELIAEIAPPLAVPTAEITALSEISPEIISTIEFVVAIAPP